MCRTRRPLLLGVATCTAFCCLVTAAASRRPVGESITTTVKVDWEKGALYATGVGVVSTKEENPAKAYLRARDYAMLVAIRNMLIAVDRVKIDSYSRGKEYEADDDIRMEVTGIVHGARVVSEREARVANGPVVEVTVTTPMYGPNGLAAPFYREMARDRAAELTGITGPAGSVPLPPVLLNPAETRPNDPPVKVQLLRPVSPQPSIADGPFTGLIIDGRGLQIERSMAPKIRRQDGSEVWGTVPADPDYVIEHGIVAYARSMEDAQRNPRAGSRPLVLKAIGRAGGNFNCDAVLSDVDAQLILEASRRTGFLDKFRVVFVVDPSN